MDGGLDVNRKPQELQFLIKKTSLLTNQSVTVSSSLNDVVPQTMHAEISILLLKDICKLIIDGATIFF